MGQHIVMTGAAGTVAHTVAATLADRHTLTLLDQLGDSERGIIPVNLSDFAAVLDAMPEADTVIHLGANPNEAEWQDILTNNFIATYNVFEVARRKGVNRIVFPSTVMIYDGFRGRADGEILTPEHHAWPMTYYAISKRFGEDLFETALASHLARERQPSD